MKGINRNDFIIDKVFKLLDKKAKKKGKKNKHDNPTKPENDCYTIEI